MLMITGGIFLISLILAFTTVPFYALYKLAVARGKPVKDPVTVVLLGGAGIPSENGLMRCYYTAGYAAMYPESQVVIAIPGGLTDTAGAPFQMAKELKTRGVDGKRILFENEGRNTRQQALNLSQRWLGKRLSEPVILVTSPEHMYRAVACFEKAGFGYVSGAPTFESSLDESQMQFDDKELKGNRNIPAIGHRPQVRYQFWNHLKYEVSVGREAFAIAYYKLKGWI